MIGTAQAIEHVVGIAIAAGVRKVLHNLVVLSLSVTILVMKVAPRAFAAIAFRTVTKCGVEVPSSGTNFGNGEANKTFSSVFKVPMDQ